MERNQSVWLSTDHSVIILSGLSPLWDVEIDSSSLVVLSLPPGTYRLITGTVRHVRPSGEAQWYASATVTDNMTMSRIDGVISTVKPHPELALVNLQMPHHHFVVGEPVTLQFLPAASGLYELRLVPAPDGKTVTRILHSNIYCFAQGLPEGHYRASVRWTPLDSESWRTGVGWTAWSIPLNFRVYPETANVTQLRIADHRLAMMLEQDQRGAITVIDPDALPPNCPEEEPVKWFRTPCYEGATMLVNEESDYYRDPLAYYLSCIDTLSSRGVRFVTWHQVLDGDLGHAECEVLLQFDIDGGPRSTQRLYQALNERGICGTIMIHRQAYDWYTYTIEDVGIDWLQEAEQHGWAVGYHNNSLSNIQRFDRVGDYSTQALAEASHRFGDDVRYLRRYFKIRTFTHHGGNVFNNRTPVPNDLNIVGVDKPVNPIVWTNVRSMFSDGGFTVRPCPLRQKVEALPLGLHFFRNHPLKYANYLPPVDVPPLNPQDLAKAGLDNIPQTAELLRREAQKERCWIELRRQYRVSRPMSYLQLDKPISERFRLFSEIKDIVHTLRECDRNNFFQQYPWVLGDPRVFWWRMIEAWAPKLGEILSINALPFGGHKDEINHFLPVDVQLLELDIEEIQQANKFRNGIDVSQKWKDRFSGTLLFNLSFTYAPSLFAATCASLAKPGGIGLFAATADTSPSSGGLWHPLTHPVWHEELESPEIRDAQRVAWSFDQKGLEKILKVWDSFVIEYFNHYWFAVCVKS